MKAKYLRVAAILEYVVAALYAVVTAVFYSVSNNLYIMFLVFGVLSLCLGLYEETLIQRTQKENALTKKDFICLAVVSCLSVVGVCPLLFNLLALFTKQESKTIKVLNENYKAKEPKEKKWFLKSSFLVAVISLVGVMATSISGHLFETSGGTVAVKDGTLTKKETDQYNKGQGLNGVEYTINDPTVKISFTEFRPKEATASNPLPVVFVMPGFTRTKATMTQYAVELSRRGSVVFTIDPGSQGATTYGGYAIDAEGNQDKENQNSYSVARSGMGYLLTYVYNNIDKYDFIDRDKIGIMGHSAGGGDATKLAADFAGSNYEESIIKSLFISGYIKTSAANVFYQLHCNTILSYGKYDEGSFRYQDENQAWEVIALRFVNEVNSKTASANGKFDEFITDYEYGNMADGTYRKIHHDEMNHCFDMYSPKSIENTNNFFRRSLGLNTQLKDTEQTWFGKEVSNGLGLAFGFALVIALVGVVVEFVPFMKSVKVEADGRLEKEQEIRAKYTADPVVRKASGEERKDKGVAKRLLFWLPMVLTAIIACLDYIPLARLSMDVFPDAAANIYTFNFPARMMNAVYLWAVINGAVGIAVWLLTTVGENLVYLALGKKDKMDWSKFAGLKVNWKNLLLTLALSVIMFFVFYFVIQVSYWTTHQDFRFMLVSASPLSKRMLMTWLIYLPGFFVFYFSNSLRVNLGIAREGLKEWQVLLISMLANSLGLVFIIVINYVVYFQTGTVFYGYYSPTDSNEMWLYINMVFALIVMMALLPIFNRLIYKKTGNVYAPALLWCMIFIMMSLSASISFIPM